MATLGFTTEFVNTLSDQRIKLSSWLESEKCRIDSIVDQVEKAHSTEAGRIEGLLKQLDDVRFQRGLATSDAGGEISNDGGMARQKQDLERKQSQLETEVENWREKNRDDEARLNEMQTQKTHYEAQALASRVKKLEIAELKNTTIDDLTKGLINYKYLGLGFERVGREGELLFKFTKLDPKAPKKSFFIYPDISA